MSTISRFQCSAMFLTHLTSNLSTSHILKGLETRVVHYYTSQCRLYANLHTRDPNNDVRAHTRDPNDDVRACTKGVRDGIRGLINDIKDPSSDIRVVLRVLESVLGTLTMMLVLY